MFANVGLPVASGRESGGVLLTAAQADRAIKPAHTRSLVANWVRIPMPAIQPLRVCFRKMRVSTIGYLVGKAGGRNMNGMTPLAAVRKGLATRPEKKQTKLCKKAMSRPERQSPGKLKSHLPANSPSSGTADCPPSITSHPSSDPSSSPQS